MLAAKISEASKKMPETHARLLTKHRDGRRAEMALDVTEPLIRARERELLDTARESYRAGCRDEIWALTIIAELAALADLRRDLQHQVRQGNRAAGTLVASAATPLGGKD